MPIYEYRCRACGETTEELRSAADADVLTACSCGEHDRVRLPSMIARPSGDLPMAGGGGGGCCGGACGCG